MKKILAAALALTLALSLAACGASPSSKPNSTSTAGSTPVTSNVASSVAPQSEAPVVSEPEPKTYPIKFARSEMETNKNIAMHQYTPCYDKTLPTTIEYTALGRDLEAVYKEKEIVWPVLNDEWKGYKYTDITNTETVSSRTMEVGQYGAKADGVIKEHIDWLKGIAGEYKIIRAETIPEGHDVVIYSYLEYSKALTPKELAGIAYEAFYIQAWQLVPAANQGVCVKTPDGIYTAEDILAMSK